MESIGTDSFRVYLVDPCPNDKDCMSAFSDAGLCVWLHLDMPNMTVIQINAHWTPEKIAAFRQVMDTVQAYDRLGGFRAGNSASFCSSTPDIQSELFSLLSAVSFPTSSTTATGSHPGVCPPTLDPRQSHVDDMDVDLRLYRAFQSMLTMLAMENHPKAMVALLVLLACFLVLLISVIFISAVMCCYHHSRDDWTLLHTGGFRPDLVDDGGLEHTGPMDEVELVLQRVRERRIRKLRGLPPGASLSGEGIELLMFRREQKGKERV